MVQNRETVSLDSRRLKDIVQSRGVKKEWIANRLGVSRITVSRWVNGHVKRIHRQTFERLVHCLNCPEEQIIYDDSSVLEAHAHAPIGALLQQLKLILDKPKYISVRCSLQRVLLDQTPSSELVFHCARISAFLKYSGDQELADAMEVFNLALNQQGSYRKDYQKGAFSIYGELYEEMSLSYVTGELSKLIQLDRRAADADILLLAAKLNHRYGDFYLTKICLDYASIKMGDQATFITYKDLFFRIKLELLINLGDWRLVKTVVNRCAAEFRGDERRFWLLARIILDDRKGEDDLIDHIKQYKGHTHLSRILVLEIALKLQYRRLGRAVLSQNMTESRSPFVLATFYFYQALLGRLEDKSCDDSLFKKSLEIFKVIDARKRIPLVSERYNSMLS